MACCCISELWYAAVQVIIFLLIVKIFEIYIKTLETLDK